jgi:hypothetical protein
MQSVRLKRALKLAAAQRKLRFMPRAFFFFFPGFFFFFFHGAMTPSTELPQRIAALFGRRQSTAWSEKEVRRYKALVRDKVLTGSEQLEIIERYYVFQRRRGEKGIHRRDLYTFLNNFAGELDRAREWDVDKRRHMGARNYQRPQREATEAEFELAGQIARNEIAKLREALHR